MPVQFYKEITAKYHAIEFQCMISSRMATQKRGVNNFNVSVYNRSVGGGNDLLVVLANKKDEEEMHDKKRWLIEILKV